MLVTSFVYFSGVQYSKKLKMCMFCSCQLIMPHTHSFSTSSRKNSSTSYNFPGTEIKYQSSFKEGFQNVLEIHQIFLLWITSNTERHFQVHITLCPYVSSTFPFMLLTSQIHELKHTMNDRTTPKIVGEELHIQGSTHKDDLHIAELREGIPECNQQEITEAIPLMNLILEETNVKLENHQFYLLNDKKYTAPWI